MRRLTYSSLCLEFIRSSCTAIDTETSGYLFEVDPGAVDDVPRQVFLSFLAVGGGSVGVAVGRPIGRPVGGRPVGRPIGRPVGAIFVLESILLKSSSYSLDIALEDTNWAHWN